MCTTSVWPQGIFHNKQCKNPLIKSSTNDTLRFRFQLDAIHTKWESLIICKRTSIWRMCSSGTKSLYSSLINPCVHVYLFICVLQWSKRWCICCSITRSRLQNWRRSSHCTDGNWTKLLSWSMVGCLRRLRQRYAVRVQSHFWWSWFAFQSKYFFQANTYTNLHFSDDNTMPCVMSLFM